MKGPREKKHNQLLIEIGAACGECAGILSNPYLRNAHQRRQRIIEAAAVASHDGRPTTPERLFAWLGDVPLTAQANLGAEGYAAQHFNILNGGPLARRATELAAATKANVGGDVIDGVVSLLFSEEQESRAACSLYLRGALGPAEPALSPFLGGIKAAAARGSQLFREYAAQRLAQASRRALENARVLIQGLAAANLVLSSAKSSSHVRGFADLLFAGHPLSVSAASRIFSVSRLTARKHLLRMEVDGLVEAVARGKIGTVYIARDGLMTLGLVGKVWPRKNESARQPLSDDDNARLTEVADAVSARIGELDRVLERLKIPQVSRG